MTVKDEYLHPGSAEERELRAQKSRRVRDLVGLKEVRALEEEVQRLIKLHDGILLNSFILLEVLKTQFRLSPGEMEAFSQKAKDVTADFMEAVHKPLKKPRIKKVRAPFGWGSARVLGDNRPDFEVSFADLIGNELADALRIRLEWAGLSPKEGAERASLGWSTFSSMLKGRSKRLRCSSAIKLKKAFAEKTLDSLRMVRNKSI